MFGIFVKRVKCSAIFLAIVIWNRLIWKEFNTLRGGEDFAQKNSETFYPLTSHIRLTYFFDPRLAAPPPPPPNEINIKRSKLSGIFITRVKYSVLAILIWKRYCRLWGPLNSTAYVIKIPNNKNSKIQTKKQKNNRQNRHSEIRLSGVPPFNNA